MLSYDEEIRKEGIDQGISVIKLLLKQKSIDDIAKELNIPLDKVEKIRDKFYQ